LKEAPDPDFAQLLAHLSESVTPAPDDVPAIGVAIRAFREALPDVTNMGETQDARDLYVQLDRLVDAVKASYPNSLCKAGCSYCCDSDTAVFDTSDAEWARLETHMATRWTDAEREAFAARFEAEHGDRLGAYRALGAIRHFEPVSDAYFAKKPYRCPFLVEGRCTVYEARPLACRMYGYFATRTRWYTPPTIYACSRQTAQFNEARRESPLHLPAADMVIAKSGRMMGRRRRILPLWIARWVKARRKAASGV
jgi:Fe-S-cluster containining protein